MYPAREGCKFSRHNALSFSMQKLLHPLSKMTDFSKFQLLELLVEVGKASEHNPRSQARPLAALC
jgi:hypothetical protein